MGDDHGIDDAGNPNMISAQIQNLNGANPLKPLRVAIQNSSVLAVDVQQNLEWFGYSTDKDMAIIAPAINFQELAEGQLLYFIHKRSGFQGFAFYSLNNEQQPCLISPERFVLEFFKIPLTSNVFKE